SIELELLPDPVDLLEGYIVLVKWSDYLVRWTFKVSFNELLIPNLFAIPLDEEGYISSFPNVFGVSSSGKGFNLSGLVSIFGRWATPVSFSSETRISSGIGSSLTGCLDGEAGFCLEDLNGASLESEVFQAEDF
nr:hypothetical protein [Tanacetum cinerariifolium]